MINKFKVALSRLSHVCLIPYPLPLQYSLSDENWQDIELYENDDSSEFELQDTDIFLCGHGQNGKGEVGLGCLYLHIIMGNLI